MTKLTVSELECGDACLWGSWEGVVYRVELRTLYAKITIPLPSGNSDVRLKRFWRDSGRTVDEYSRFRLTVASPQASSAAQDARRHRALVFALKDFEHWDLTPTDDLERVAKILKVKIAG